MNRLVRLRALIRKETLQIVRDPGSIIIAFVLPPLLLFLFGYGVSLDTEDVRIGLVVEEPSPAVSGLADSFRGSRYFMVSEGRDRREFEDALVNGTVRGIVVLPATLTRDLAEGRPAAIQVLTDGVDPNTAKFVSTYVAGTTIAWNALRTESAALPPPAIRVDQRFWFNPELASRFFLVPGAIAIVMTIVGTLLTSLVVAREWERGTMEAMMATPVTATELLLGKLVPYFLLGLASMTLCVALAVFVFGVPFRGTAVALYILSGVFLLPALGMGLVISALARNQFLAAQAGLLVGFLPSFLLSGFIFEINSMPWLIRLITLAVPARHLIPSIQTVFLAGDVWPMFLSALAVLGGMGLALLAATRRLTGKRL